jgi:Secretion system C-terminal sorting domain
MKTTAAFILISILFCGSLHGQSWLWAITNNATCSGSLEGAPIVADRMGNVIVSGDWIGDSVTFGTHTLYCNSTEAFVIKVDPTGNVLWATGTTSGFCFQKAIGADAAGNTLFMGEYLDSCRIGSLTLHAGSYYITDFIAKISPGGTVLWAKNISKSGGYFYHAGIDADASGNIYVAGSFTGLTATVGTTILTNNNPAGDSTDILLIKYDSLGNVVWATSFGGHNDDRSVALSVSGAGNVYVAGDFLSQTMIIGADTLTDSLYGTVSPFPQYGYFMAKFDSSGHPVWAKELRRHIQLADLKTGKQEEIYITGSIDSTITIGADTLATLGYYQSVVVCYDSGGAPKWANCTGSLYDGQGYYLAPDSCGNVWVTGYSMGDVIFDTTVVAAPGVYHTLVYMAAYDHCGRYIPGTGQVFNAGIDDLSGIAVDNRGNVFVGGDYSGTPTTFGAYTLATPAGGREFLYVAKYHTGDLPCGSYSCTPPLGSKPISADRNITVYPNPASDELTISCDAGFAANSHADIIDMTGRVMGTYSLTGSSTVISLLHFVAGIYQCRVTGGDGSVVGKKVVVGK